MEGHREQSELPSDRLTVVERWHASVLLLSLPSPAASRATTEAIAALGADQRIVIEASTLALKGKLAIGTALQAVGHVALDCPISGTGAQALSGDLVIYASGDAQSIATRGPLFAGSRARCTTSAPTAMAAKRSLLPICWWPFTTSQVLKQWCWG